MALADTITLSDAIPMDDEKPSEGIAVDPAEEARIRRKAQLDSLAAQIRSEFEDAWNDRQRSGVTARLHKCIRLSKGKYAQDMADAIKSFGGNEYYFNLLGRKGETARAWIRDTIGPENYEPEMEPTPLPDLPDEEKQVHEAAMSAALMVHQAQGWVPSPEDEKQAKEQAAEERHSAIIAEATKRAKKMTDKIRAQYQEAGFTKAFTEFCNYFTKSCAAFLKTEQRSVKKARWVGNQLKIVNEVIFKDRAVDPLDMYPGPNVETTNEGYVCETVNYGVGELKALIGAEGWNGEEIRAALAEKPRPSNERFYLPDESERLVEENKTDYINEGLATGLVCCIDYWGPAWDETGYERDTEIHAILLGHNVIYSRENPHPLGLRPYFHSAFEKIPGTVWGQALCEKAEPEQEAANGAARNLADNQALAAGPILVIDSATYEGDTPEFIGPRMILKINSAKQFKPGGKPIESINIPMNSMELRENFKFFSSMIEEATGILSYGQNNTRMFGGRHNASAMSMIFGAQGKTMRDLISNIEVDVLRPRLEYNYIWNLEYLPDDKFADIKGDCQIKAIGPLGIMSREITDMRIKEFLDMIAANEKAFMIIGPERFAEGLREYAERLRLPSSMIPTMEEIRTRFASMMAMGNGEGNGQPSGAQPPPALPGPNPEAQMPNQPPAQPVPDANLMGGASAQPA